jgi:type I restriction enzyme R subunit
MPGAAIHTEHAFENAIEDSLVDIGGYTKGNPADFDPSRALFPATLIAFFKSTQSEPWAKLAKLHGASIEAKIAALVAKELDLRGTLDVLRHGITDSGVKLRLAFFKPASGLNPEALALYGKNVLTVTRQVHFALKNPALSLDLVLALNGVPVATAELKSPFTLQTVEHARRQYETDRDPTEPLLRWKVRALIHFAVDPDLVFMTTRLAGKDTRFLPFNKGRGTGAGNPDNPNGYRTAYLWEQIWAKDNWLDIIARFVHVEKTTKGVEKEIVFPRFHQWDAVTKVLAHVGKRGVGENYLIEHSAGSGKSNSIAWLAHRLSGLHGVDDKPVFSSVIVITDRRVLDKQLQDNIYQFEHKQGVVEKIDTNSAKLSAALTSGKPIIITTIQKFPHVAGVAGKSGRAFAVIVDEAHGSQTGESASKLKAVLAAASLEQAEEEEKDDSGDEIEDEVLKAIAERGRQPNLSFFAFTATPKKRTIELFGQPGADGKPTAFHLYSMRQAIEEGFILDVLENYTTYKTYYRFAKAVDDDPQVEKAKAKRAIARYASLHPHNLAQKTEVAVEHFRAHTRTKIGGRAKAMVVTRSRLHAVRYKQAFDAYLKDKDYTDIGVLVAFSGTVTDDNVQFTEAMLNKFPESELPEKFAASGFHILIVAEKYQTGFDQPLLHTMFVDKKLKGLRAVQTLSRLNRMCPGKVDTFVLDFENETTDILDGFAPYYEQPEIDEPTDPNQLYTLKTNLEAYQYYWKQEVEDFARTFFKPKAKQKKSDQGLLHAALNPAVTRFGDEPDEDRQDEFRALLVSYVRLYGFVSQIAVFGDPDLEKLYVFARLLRTKLPKRLGGGLIDLDDDVLLTYYRMDKTHEGAVALPVGETQVIKGASEVGTGKQKDDDLSALSKVIDLINERFGTDFAEGDRLLMEQALDDLSANTTLEAQARANTLENFRHAFDPAAIDALLNRNQRNGEITADSNASRPPVTI